MSSISSAQLTNITLSNNTASGAGGGLAIQRSQQIHITDSNVINNSAPLGGGLATDSSMVELRGVNMTGNSAQVVGEGEDQVRTLGCDALALTLLCLFHVYPVWLQGSSHWLFESLCPHPKT
jgi:parallel beta-helix repeat protein